MSLEAWFTVAVIGFCLGLLIHGRTAPDIVMMAGLTLLLVTGILTPTEALSGLSNEGMVTVGIMFVIVTGLRDTGAIAWIVQHLLGCRVYPPGCHVSDRTISRGNRQRPRPNGFAARRTS